LKALRSGVGGFIKLTHRILIKLLSHLLFYNSNNTVSYIWTKYIFYNLMITVRIGDYVDILGNFSSTEHLFNRKQI
jgi:hypothetical protein